MRLKLTIDQLKRPADVDLGRNRNDANRRLVAAIERVTSMVFVKVVQGHWSINRVLVSVYRKALEADQLRMINLCRTLSSCAQLNIGCMGSDFREW